jgi:hypothetical protein
MPANAQKKNGDGEKRQRDGKNRPARRQVAKTKNRKKVIHRPKPGMGWDYHYLITPFVI